jgi:uncharacterized membrane protein YciS (DUF1049 family)
MDINFWFLQNAELDIILLISAVFLLEFIITALIFVSKNRKLREKIAFRRAEREEKRAMRKRNK